MHAWPLERSDITIVKAFACGAPLRRIAALSAVSAGSSHRAVTCFQPKMAVSPERNGWLS
ncbi:hypothetical protein FHT92_001834 [Rhizobium sp. BK377]|nr:hypothetical protein [Rhizobium sp. BK377]